MACERNEVGRYPAGDGDIDSCIKYQKDHGRSYAVYGNGQCWGSITCSSPYPASGMVSYEVKNRKGSLLNVVLIWGYGQDKS